MFLAWSIVALVYSVVASITSFVVSTTLSTVSSTPVNTSTYSFPASLTESKAPLKSPLNTFTIASLKNPITSKAELNLSIRLSFIALPNDFKFSTGFSNISLKKPTTVPILDSINTNKSLKANFKAVVAVAKVSTTF